MTYGALVVQLIQDYEDYAEVNKQLDMMYVSKLICDLSPQPSSLMCTVD